MRLRTAQKHSLATNALAGASARGQGAVEFLLAAVPVLLLGLSSIEAVHWYFSRQAVSLALSQAARAAITQHANPMVLDQAFSQALLPLFAGPSRAVSRHRLQLAMQRRELDTGLPAWRIYIVSPSAASFSDFSSTRPDLPPAEHAVIDNDYLLEQHQARQAGGWAQGRGPVSGQTTFEANTLTLHLTWLHRPLLPGVRNLVRWLAPTDSRYGPLAMARGGYLPVHRQLAMVMQSHAIEWELPAHGRVVRMASPNAPEPPALREPASQAGPFPLNPAPGPLSWVSGPHTGYQTSGHDLGGSAGTGQSALLGNPESAAGARPPDDTWQGHTMWVGEGDAKECDGLWCPRADTYLEIESDAASAVLEDCPGCCE